MHKLGVEGERSSAEVPDLHHDPVLRAMGGFDPIACNGPKGGGA